MRDRPERAAAEDPRGVRPAIFPAPPPIVRELCARLPQFPHSVALSVFGNLFLRSLFGPGDTARIAGKVLCLNVRDAGIRVKLRILPGGYFPCLDATAPDATVSAGAREFVLLALRKEDPDTLFFDRRLVIEGDTELGLLVKNALDRLELPLPPGLLAFLRERIS